MATLAEIVDAVRKKVSDFEVPRRFDNSYYESAVDFALRKLSHDYSETYLTVDSVPFDREFLLIKLASIEMCYTRATSEVSDPVGDSDEDLDALTNVSAPDITITRSSKSIEGEANRWLKLAEMLQTEYDNELSSDGGPSLTTEITDIVINRRSTKTGGLMSRKLDMGLPAVTVSAVVDGMQVTLSWTVLYSDLFNYYEVCRATDAAFSDEEVLGTITDNHEVEYVDTVAGLGNYYYRVKTVNYNNLKTESSYVLVGVV